jgi:hypothetical protein
MQCTLQSLKTESLTKAKERAISADGCRRVSVRVSVQQYSVQYKGYNLIRVTTVEASATRGTTVLVYSLINSSLHTGTVQRWWSTPNWLDGHQGRSHSLQGRTMGKDKGEGVRVEGDDERGNWIVW